MNVKQNINYLKEHKISKKMQTNRLNLRKVIVIAICFAGLAVFLSCEKTENSIIGKWVTSDYHAGDANTIVFKENLCVEQYFDYLADKGTSSYITYSLSGDKIIFTTAFSYLPPEILEYFPVSETFEYVLKGNSLIIKGFSNPFSGTEEMKKDVLFKKVK